MTIKRKVSVWFVSLNVLEATFCLGVKAKRPTRNPVCIRETPVKVGGDCPRRQKNLGTALIMGKERQLSNLSSSFSPWWNELKANFHLNSVEIVTKKWIMMVGFSGSPTAQKRRRVARSWNDIKTPHVECRMYDKAFQIYRYEIKMP